MTEEQIVALVSADHWMIDILQVAEAIDLPNWLIGAGFVRNKVWDYLHGHATRSPVTDIDLAYFDADEKFDDKSSEIRLSSLRPTLKWDVKNQATAHRWNNEEPCASVAEALARWPETATAIGVTLSRGHVKLIAPHGIDDLIELIVRPTSAFMSNSAKCARVECRFRQKRWKDTWPKLKLELFPREAGR